MDNRVFYVNGCVREGSRTDWLARKLLCGLGDYTELRLAGENLKPLDRETLEHREKLISEGRYDDDLFRYARQFAQAEIIVISAPYWDLSFPALLKIYLENIYITGLVTKFDETGRQIGLCRASKLYYVTTAGGPYISTFSYGYIGALAEAFGIGETELVYAEMLDIAGNDPQKLLNAVVLPV